MELALVDDGAVRVRGGAIVGAAAGAGAGAGAGARSEAAAAIGIRVGSGGTASCSTGWRDGALQVGQKAVNSLTKGIIALGSFLAIVGLGMHPVLMILAGGLLGAILFRKEAGA